MIVDQTYFRECTLAKECSQPVGFGDITTRNNSYTWLGLILRSKTRSLDFHIER